jgi:hypothetical protein
MGGKNYQALLVCLYYKTLRIRNLQQMARFRSKLVPLLMSVTNTITWTNPLAYHGIRKLRISSVSVFYSLGTIFTKRDFFVT